MYKLSIYFENLKELIVFMRDTTIELMVLDVVGMLLFLTICILLRSIRAGLLVAFIFSLKFAWSFVSDYGVFWSAAYLVFGLAVVIFSIIAGMLEGRE